MNDFPVTHNSAESRFEVKLEGELCVLNYLIRGNQMLFTHTGVPPALKGAALGRPW